MLNYGFFDYKYNIPNFGSDLFSTAHIVFIILAYVFTVVFGVAFRATKHRSVDIFLKVLSIVMPVLEITKISWESYYDMTTGSGFNFGGLLPLYTCSLFIYTLLFAAWGRGRAKEYSLSFISTISMVSGAIGVVYCNGLNFYPFWTFGAFYSMLFHSTMMFTGFFVLATGYKKLDVSDIWKGWIPMLFLSVVAIPVNYILHVDYMQVYEGSGVPLYSDLAKVMAGVGLRPLFTAFMLASYMILSGLIVGISKLIEYVSRKRFVGVENKKVSP